MSTSPEDKLFPACAETPLTAGQAFAALSSFLEAFWERSGKPNDSMANLLSWIQPSMLNDSRPADPAMWADWLDAIERTRR